MQHAISLLFPVMTITLPHHAPNEHAISLLFPVMTITLPYRIDHARAPNEHAISLLFPMMTITLLYRPCTQLARYIIAFSCDDHYLTV
jgi:hypothetical protein